MAAAGGFSSSRHNVRFYRGLSILLCPVVLFTAGCFHRRGAKEHIAQTKARLRASRKAVFAEAATDRFVTLVDFELFDGPAQAKWFSVGPDARSGTAAYSKKRPRTGDGCLAGTIEKGGFLSARLPEAVDISSYTLIGLAIRVERTRDDLICTLHSRANRRGLAPKLLRAGWNAVYLDVHRAELWDGFDETALTGFRIEFESAAGPVVFSLDDLVLIDNRRDISPVPPGVELHRCGLGYTVRVAEEADAHTFARGRDGLWRMGEEAALSFDALRKPSLGRLGPLGPLAGPGAGEIALLESSPVRLRIRNAWYFPPRHGAWYMPAVRHIIREHTWYAGGRRVTHIRLNNAGGEPIRRVTIDLGRREAAWASGETGPRRHEENFVGPVASWSYLVAPAFGRRWMANYRSPGRLEPVIADGDVFAPGDGDRDRFDESQGCYCLQARDGRCRFRVIPGAAALKRPVVRVMGPWNGDVSINVEGRAVREYARLDDGSVLFCLPQDVDRPVFVELSGSNGQSPLPDKK